MSTLANWAASLDISTFLSLFLFFAIALHFFSSKPFKNLPPGPLNLPIVGYTPFVIGKNLGQVFVKLKKKYGDVVYLRLGSLPVVSLNSYDTIKEALLLNPHISLTRPTKFYARSYIFQELGISSENGKNWYDQRRFLMSALRDLGFGKENLENQIREEGLALVKDLQAHVGQPCDLQLLFQCATANIITMLMFGFRYNYEDPIIHSELSDQFKLLKYLSPLHILNGFPYLRLIIPASMSGMKEMEDSKNEIAKYMNSKIEDHGKTRNDIRDYTSIYLKKQKQDLDSGFQNTPFHNRRLSSHLLALNVAGIASTSSSLYWALKMLIRFPQMQKQIQMEIDTVIGSGRIPYYTDRFNMPYMEAFFMEIQRFGSITPVGVPHSAEANTTIAGYHIPAGVTVLTQIYLVHHDPTLWGDPETFRPERFIDCNGKVIKSEYLIPFGMGKRNCLGENLAKTEIFIFFANILQNFNISACCDEDTEIRTVKISITRDLVPFKVTLEERHISGDNTL